MSDHRETIALSEAQPPLFVGIDVGGTNIKIGLVDDHGRTLGYLSIPTAAETGAEDASRRMGEAARQVIAAAGVNLRDVGRAGLGTPGTMDIPNGMLLEPTNIKNWRNFPIRDRVGFYLGLPVTFSNDAKAAAYGEYWIGSGRAMHSMVLITLGTGIGGGIIIGDLMVMGQHSHGSEVGHAIIDYRDDARECSCGQRGHLEAYAGANAVVKRTQEKLAAGRTSTLTARLAAGEKLTPLSIATEAAGGDALSDEIVMETARFLGIGIVSLMHTIDPTGVVLGGAMTFGGAGSELGRRFLERVREEVRRRAFEIPAAKTTIEFAQLGGDAGYIGAAGLARAEHRRG